MNEEENVDMITDLMINHDVAVLIEKTRCDMSRDDALSLLRSLNDFQRKAFYQIRRWCLAKCHGDNPDPFYVFKTGSAGTWKSLLIKAIQYGRLRQIKQTGDYSPFGKVCIIAVGDFYQLPPCRNQPLYDESHLVNSWADNFAIIELQEIVRQNDVSFVELLNRIRKLKKGEPLLEADINML